MQLSNSEKERLKKNYGEWAIVTGSSSGIGFEIAMQLADAGFNLLINARYIEKLVSVKDFFEKKFAIKIEIVDGDISLQTTIDQIIEIAQQYNIGLLVNNAGYGTSGLFTNNSLHVELDMLRVNTESVLKLTHYFAQTFKQQKRGGIIFLSSMVAFQGTPYAANYAATKAYIQTLAEGLAVELKPFGVDVLAAAPGPVLTSFAKRANMQMQMSLTPEQIGAPILKALGRKTTVLPGFLTKLLVYSLRTVPRWAKVNIMAKVMGEMTKHQR
jgi:uncharacterized protein